MNSVLFHLADGTSFFARLVITFLACLTLRFFRPRWLHVSLTATAATGIVLVVISATPLPIWFYAIWILSASAGLITNYLSRA